MSDHKAKFQAIFEDARDKAEAVDCTLEQFAAAMKGWAIEFEDRGMAAAQEAGVDYSDLDDE
jgi:hypothetical protein